MYKLNSSIFFPIYSFCVGSDFGVKIRPVNHNRVKKWEMRVDGKNADLAPFPISVNIIKVSHIVHFYVSNIKLCWQGVFPYFLKNANGLLHTHRRRRTQTDTHPNTQTHTHTHTHTHTQTHTHTHTRTRTRTHAHAHAHTRTSSATHTHTHTHTHAHTNSHTHTHKHCNLSILCNTIIFPRN